MIRPEHIHPTTAVDILEQILARDDAARSATTEHRELHDPAVRLGDAATRYHDALHTAAQPTSPRPNWSNASTRRRTGSAAA